MSNELDFTLSLIDKITKPLASVKASVAGFAEASQDAFGKLAIGGAGLAASFWSIKGFLDPAIEMEEALQTASLQGIDSNVMDKVAKDAMTFSSRYGKSSIEFVQSASAISKAIGSLSQNDLPQMTHIVNTTAAALKSSAEDASTYMGQMFAQFSSHAKDVGHLQFAEELAGKAVLMSKTFGTSMTDIADLMEGARAAGTNFGIGIDEQLAVLGELQRSLGSESSGAYESFITTAEAGGKKLGLSFVNASGKLLSMPEMLEKLQAKYGKSIEGNLKAQAEIDEAFGDSAVVIKQLYGNVDVLRKNMTALGANDGMKRTREMAERMANPWERLEAIWQNIRIAIGSTLLPVIKPLVNQMADASQTLVRWLKLFPNIARWVGYISLGILSFAAAGALANIVMGVSRFIWLGLIPLWNTGAFMFSLLTGKMNVMSTTSTKLASLLTRLRASLVMTQIASWATAAGFTAMAWPVLAIIAVIAALVIAVIKFWQPIKAFIKGFMQGFSEAGSSLAPLSPAFDAIGAAMGFVWEGVKSLFGWFAKLLSPIQYTDEELQGVTEAGSSFGRIVAGAIGLMMMPFNLVIQVIGTLIQAFQRAGQLIRQGWDALWNWVGSFSLVDTLSGMADSVGDLFSGLWDSIKASFGEAYNWIIEKLNYIPGINIETKAIEGAVSTPKSVVQPSVDNQQVAASIITGGQLKGINKGGLSQNLNSHKQTSIDNSRRIENVTVKVNGSITPEQLTEWEQVAYG
ncbi:phage tail tape measure protein [Xenorhabdus doucetiae]|uniref:Putative phage protein n=1 Tax=Xenorhabdus doucetiae TaxID=351671 RepID=A0A068QV54_9GAMM|nr:phage tail tape measure protein [Xenorhabdus doucetiae]TYO98385.1 TP901 family phage tail tape measure protein [Xenorhabdus doucetiae]CDG18541.1 putative phage gene [Xenorhabdus doucetiae]CDG19120.1 putative phage gene [Xenorhabdus doucetiae]